jgi:hypothetical protein
MPLESSNLLAAAMSRTMDTIVDLTKQLAHPDDQRLTKFLNDRLGITYASLCVTRTALEDELFDRDKKPRAQEMEQVRHVHCGNDCDVV